MKIVYLIDDFLPYQYTSSGILTFRLARELKKQGHEIFVIARTDDKEKQGWLDHEGLRIYFIYSNYPSILHNYLSLINPQTIFKVKKILKDIKPDIVHFQHIHKHLSYYCFKLARKYSRAVFLTAHDVMLFNYGKLTHFIDKNDLSVKTDYDYRVSWWQSIKQAKKRHNPFRNIIIKHYLKYIDKIFAVSNTLKKALADNGIDNVVTIYNSIDVDDYQVSLDKIDKFKNKYRLINKKVIFFGGRLSQSKGGEELISALDLIVKSVPETILFLASEKTGNWGRMSKLIKTLNLENQVIISGWLSESEMAVAYNSIDVCVTPSTCLDTFNLFNIEAMAAKKPVVGTCFGGIPEIVIDNQTGYIVNPLNTKVMAAKIIDLLKDPQKAKKFGQAGYERVKKEFHLEKQVRETLIWYTRFSIIS